MLGVLYFSDLTELYQVRDEYIRSRPVVAIILIDNYEELTKNLTESAISSMNAKLNETITRWTEGYSGLLRRLERNRFLFIFEKRDLERAKENKFSLLEDIHEIVNSSGLPASISIGLGVDGEKLRGKLRFCRAGHRDGTEPRRRSGGHQETGSTSISTAGGTGKRITAARYVPV